MKSILDPTFRYTSSVNTDLRKTFAKVRKELRKGAQRVVAANDGTAGSVPLHNVGRRITS
jgi:hypothetical protein